MKLTFMLDARSSSIEAMIISVIDWNLFKGSKIRFGGGPILGFYGGGVTLGL